MSGTYLYLVSPAAIARTVQEIHACRSSPAAFEAFLTDYWGDARYAHERFLSDLANRAASGRDVYYLAHALVVNRHDIESVFMDVELYALFLDCVWLAMQDPAPDDELTRFARARAKRGFRIESDDVDAAAMAIAAEHELSPTFGRDLALLNGLCNGRRTAEPETASGYPLWIVAGWDNYEGCLAASDLAVLGFDDPSGFLSLFKRAAAGGAESWQIALVDRLAAVRDKAMRLGPDALCLAISSV